MIIVSLTSVMKSLWGLAFLASSFALIFIALGISIYIALSRDFSTMLRALVKSEALSKFRQLFDGGNLGSKVMLTSMVSALFIWPQYFIRKGWLDAQELKTFPSGLRRRLLISTWVNLIGVVGLFIASGAIWIIRL